MIKYTSQAAKDSKKLGFVLQGKSPKHREYLVRNSKFIIFKMDFSNKQKNVNKSNIYAKDSSISIIPLQQFEAHSVHLEANEMKIIALQIFSSDNRTNGFSWNIDAGEITVIDVIRIPTLMLDPSAFDPFTFAMDCIAEAHKLAFIKHFLKKF